jgi:hypothetical protein
MQALSHDAKITRHSNAIAAGATNVTTVSIGKTLVDSINGTA